MEFVIVIINTSSWKTNFWAQDCKNLWNRQKLEVNVSPKGLFMVIVWFRIRTQLHFVENSKVLFCFALITCSGYMTKSWSKFSNNSITSSWILFWKFDKLRDLIQSKLSYAVEELLSDLERFYESHTFLRVQSLGCWHFWNWGPLLVMIFK